MTKVSEQVPRRPKQFKLGHLGNLNQVTKGLAKTIRAMADGSLDSQVGARICNGLGIMRACLETAALERIERRLEELSGVVGQREIRKIQHGITIDDQPAYGTH